MKKILKFIGKYKIFLVLSVLLATVSVILQLYVPILFGDAIDQIVAEHQVQFDAMWILLREILVCKVVLSSEISIFLYFFIMSIKYFINLQKIYTFLNKVVYS